MQRLLNTRIVSAPCIEAFVDGNDILLIETPDDYALLPAHVAAVVAARVSPSIEVLAATPRQIRQALTAAGLRAQVESAVAAADQDTKDWWDFAQQVESNHPVVLALCDSLGFSAAQVRSVFELAVSL